MANGVVEKFLNGETISYRCFGVEGGRILARWNDAWEYRHETDAAWKSEPMSAARARCIFPTDARLEA